MRRFALLALSLAATQAFALGFSQKDTLTNTRYQESPEEVAAREFKEHKAELPPLPDTQRAIGSTSMSTKPTTSSPKSCSAACKSCLRRITASATS